MSNDITGTLPRLQPQTHEASLPRPIEAVPTPKEVLSPVANNKRSVSIDPEAKRRELQEAMERLNEQAKKNNYSLSFSVDDTSDYVVVKIRDADNGEVVRQIPNDTVLRVSTYFKGLLKDEKI